MAPPKKPTLEYGTYYLRDYIKLTNTKEQMVKNVVFNYMTSGVSIWYISYNNTRSYGAETYENGKYNVVVSMDFDSYGDRNKAIAENNRRLIAILSTKYDNTFKAYNQIGQEDPSGEPTPISDYLPNIEDIKPIEII